jgi:adenylate cyclase
MSRPESTRTGGRRLILLCGITPAIIVAALALYRPALFGRLEDAVYDMLLRWAGPKAHSGRVVIVDVDERSLTTIGQWPWRRELIGTLVEKIRALGAASVALDIIFPESDRHQEDAALERTLGQGGVLVGYAMTFDDGAVRPRDACALHPLNLAVVNGDETPPFFRASGVICSLPQLARAANASGFLNAAPDADGILRRAPLIIEHAGRVYPSLALTAVALAGGTNEATLRVSTVNSASLIVGDLVVPVDGRANLLLRYRGEKRAFPYVSAAAVLRDEPSAQALRDKLVLVGTTALGTREVVATPLDTLFTGVEVQATIADNLIQRDFIRRQDLGTTVESLIVLKLAVAIAVVVAGTRMLWGGMAAAGGLVALWSAAAWLLGSTGIYMSPLFPTIGVLAAFGVMALGKSTIEGRRADDEGHERITAQRLMVQTLLSLVETRDAETGRHSRRTQEYARLLARSLAENARDRAYLTPARIELLASLAPLHDIGKVGVPDVILNKPSKLNDEELAEMRKHPLYGRDVILKAEREVGVRDDAILAMAKDIVYTHHEKWDGTGYPEGLSGTAIPIEGRLMAVVDVYDAAVTRNIYRKPITHDEAVAFIARAKGTHFDPAVVDAFLRVAPGFKDISDEHGH